MLKFDFGSLNAYLEKLKAGGIKPSLSYLRKAKLGIELLQKNKVPELREGYYTMYLEKINFAINMWKDVAEQREHYRA